jgi:hypothetical protein
LKYIDRKEKNTKEGGHKPKPSKIKEKKEKRKRKKKEQSRTDETTRI